MSSFRNSFLMSKILQEQILNVYVYMYIYIYRFLCCIRIPPSTIPSGPRVCVYAFACACINHRSWVCAGESGWVRGCVCERERVHARVCVRVCERHKYIRMTSPFENFQRQREGDAFFWNTSKITFEWHTTFTYLYIYNRPIQVHRNDSCNLALKTTQYIQMPTLFCKIYFPLLPYECWYMYR